MSEDNVRNVIIIGGGPSGYTAAIYTGRAALNPLVLAGYQAGGQLMLTTEVENFPGFPNGGVLGPELMEKLKLQALEFGAEIINDDVTKIDLSKRPFTVNTYEKEFKTHSIIISTGASAKWLGLESEQKLIGSGVSSCATCDGAFFKDKIVATVGGGDSAMEESTFLTKFASKVYLIHRRDEFRASKIMQERAMKNKKIEILYNSAVSDVYSEKDGFIEKVTGIQIQDTKNQQTRDISLDGVFVAIGHKPNTDIFKDQIELDEMGYIITETNTMTSVEGVFAAGDVVDKRYRQAITAAGDGCRAAIDVEKWLAEKGIVE